MNLIELENLVKGVPDDYLTKEVQAPSGKIPPFLALSEIQRRKDMRQRYEAQKGAVDKPTIAQQLTGGIGAMQQQGAPAPAMPGGAGAPPVAPGAAPMPTPPGQPQGFAAGGIVKMAKAGEVPYNPTQDYMQGYWERYFPEVVRATESVKKITGLPSRAVGALYDTAGNIIDPETYAGNESLQRALDVSSYYPKEQTIMAPLYPVIARAKQVRAAVDPQTYLGNEELMSQIGPEALMANFSKDAQAAPKGRAAGAAPAPTAQGRPVAAGQAARLPTGAGVLRRPTGEPASVSATETAGPAPVVSRGGIGEFPVPAMTPIPGAPAAKGLRYETDAEARYAELLDPTKNPDMFKLPEAINYDEFIQAAGQEEAAIREAAKREALGAALVQLGAGLAAGNMAEGFQNAGLQAQQAIKEGRRDAAAQKTLAQELKLRGMEGKREQAIQQAKMTLEGAGLAAGLARQTRQEQEERAFRRQELAQRAADREEVRRARLQSFDLSLEKYELEKRKDRIALENDLVVARIGAPPTPKMIEEWESLKKIKSPNAGRDPRLVYAEARNAVLPEVRMEVGAVFGDRPVARTAPPPPPADSVGAAPKANSPAQVAALKAKGYKMFTGTDGRKYQIP